MQQKAAKQGITDYSEEARPDTRPASRRNRELRIREIIVAARQVFQEDGYAGFTARRVAERVGIALGNLQYYFRTKEELLRAALLAYMSQIAEDYTAIAGRSGLSAARRCTMLIDRIFHNINETDLSKFMIEVWALAQHESHVAELVDDMYVQYRGIFARLLSEIHPSLTSGECLVRACVIVSQMDGMTLFASHGESLKRDYVEFVRMTKRSVKMIVGTPAKTLESETAFRGSRTHHPRGGSGVRFDVFGSDENVVQGRLDLTTQPAQDVLYYRPTEQGRRREVKINETISTAANLLAAEGYANFTLARVARELGILPSALQNYFPTHDDLVRSTIGALMKAYLDRYAEMGKPSGKPALERLCEIVEDVFEEACNSRVCRFVLEMFALAQHSDITRELVRSVYAAYRAVCADLIHEIDSSATARECLARATLIAAQVDGAATLMFGAQKQPLRIDRVFDMLMAVTIRVAHGRIATNDAA